MGEACNFNEGIIADGCCNYKNACDNNKGEIKLGSKECGATAAPTPVPSANPTPAPTPSPTKCTKTCIDHHWTSCGYRRKCPSGYKKIYESDGPCWFGTKRFVCESRRIC